MHLQHALPPSACAIGAAACFSCRCVSLGPDPSNKAAVAMRRVARKLRPGRRMSPHPFTPGRPVLPAAGPCPCRTQQLMPQLVSTPPPPNPQHPPNRPQSACTICWKLPRACWYAAAASPTSSQLPLGTTLRRSCRGTRHWRWAGGGWLAAGFCVDQPSQPCRQATMRCAVAKYAAALAFLAALGHGEWQLRGPCS